jgi:chromosome segregation ATPase
VRHIEDRELVPLKSDFDTVWYGYRRSQVKFYIQQTENEIRLVTEDRDSALSQVGDLSAQLNRARAEVESLKQQLDEQARSPIDPAALTDRLRRMVRLAQDEADDIVAAAQSASEHEWARSEQAAAELRKRYEKLVAEADEWRRQSELQRVEMLARTREEVQAMAREAEQNRRRLDAEAEERRTQVEHDFEVSMAARREEAARLHAEREQKSREEAQRRVREATAEAERRIRRADEYAETMLRMRQDVAERVRAAQQVLAAAEPFLAATEEGAPSEMSDAYVAEAVYSGQLPSDEVSVPKQREEEPAPEDSAATAMLATAMPEKAMPETAASSQA